MQTLLNFGVNLTGISGEKMFVLHEPSSDINPVLARSKIREPSSSRTVS
jgi:hypothetical protein